jgi:hypothetical protein
MAAKMPRLVEMANATFFQAGKFKQYEGRLGAGEGTDPFFGFSAIAVLLDFDLAIGVIPEPGGKNEGRIARGKTNHE